TTSPTSTLSLHDALPISSQLPVHSVFPNALRPDEKNRSLFSGCVVGGKTCRHSLVQLMGARWNQVYQQKRKGGKGKWLPRHRLVFASSCCPGALAFSGCYECAVALGGRRFFSRSKGRSIP